MVLAQSKVNCSAEMILYYLFVPGYEPGKFFVRVSDHQVSVVGIMFKFQTVPHIKIVPGNTYAKTPIHYARSVLYRVRATIKKF